MNLGAARLRARGIGVRHARRIDAAAGGLEHDAADAREVHELVQPFGFVAADLVELHPVEPRLRGLDAQLMLARFGLGKVERARLEHAAALPGLGLELPVELHRIVLQAADVGTVVQPVDVGRRCQVEPDVSSSRSSSTTSFQPSFARW